MMGTLRWEKECAIRGAEEVAVVEGKLKRLRLEAEETDLQVRLKTLRAELAAKHVEKVLLARNTANRNGELMRSRKRMRELRGADDIAAPRKARQQ